jgi:hypothetical protein
MKHRHTIVHSRVGRCGSHKKRVRTRYAEFVFLHLVRYVGHVVRSGGSKARNIYALFLMLEWTRCGSHMKRVRISYSELVFLHSVRSVGHVVASGAPGYEEPTHYFS